MPYDRSALRAYWLQTLLNSGARTKRGTISQDKKELTP